MAIVTGSVTPGLNFLQTPANAVISGTSIPIPLTIGVKFANGTAADQIDLVYANRLTFVSATLQTLDLTALTDVLGAAVNFARVKFLAVKIYTQTDAASLTLGAAAANPWAAIWGATGTHVVFPSSAGNPDAGWFIADAPNTTGMVVSGASKVLKLLPSAHAFTCDVVIAGCSV